MNVSDVDFEFSDEEDDDVSDGTIPDIDSESDSDEDSSRFDFFGVNLFLYIQESRNTFCLLTHNNHIETIDL